MKYRNILAFFLAALPVSIIIRLLQVLYVTEPVTGFVKKGFEGVNALMVIIMVIAVSVTAILSFTAHRQPTKPTRFNPLLAVASFALGGSMAYEIINETFVSAVRYWQIILLDIFGMLSVLFFIIYGIALFIRLPLPRLLSLIPAVYCIMRLICIFTTISSLTLVMDNVMILASYCAVLLFFTSFAKLYNGIDSEHNFRKLLASGLCSAVICFADSIPRVIIRITGNASALRHSASSTAAILLFGVFSLFFTLTFFSRRNREENNKPTHRH